MSECRCQPNALLRLILRSPSECEGVSKDGAARAASCFETTAPAARLRFLSMRPVSATLGAQEELEIENRNSARRRHRPRGRPGSRQGDEGRRRQDRPRHRMARVADRQGRPREARQHAAEDHRRDAAQHRRLDHGADRPQRLSARRHDLGDAAGAQEIRPVHGAAPRAVASDHSRRCTRTSTSRSSAS